jgi:hypothetical protein
MSDLATGTLSNTDMVMSMLGSKVASGQKLTLAEDLIAMTMTTRILFESMGPTPSTMKVRPVELPENVKGVLADYASV